eukprot:3114218-Pyramimonas_sp.AAC.1
MSALRAVHFPDQRRLRSALAAYERLRVHFDNDLNCRSLNGLTQRVHCLHRKALEEGEKELSRAEVDDLQRRALKAKLERRQLLWRKFRRRSVHGAVTDESGNPCRTLEEPAKALGDFWANTFSKPCISEDLWTDISPHIQKLENPLPEEWKLDYISWHKMLIKRPRSMPGPDGIPCAVWKIPSASRLFYSCYLTLFQEDFNGLPDEDMPDEGMRCSLLVFLPKGVEDADRAGFPLLRSPACTRPLSMNNTDVKLLAAACILPVVSNTKDMIGGEQKCVGGRDMMENV